MKTIKNILGILLTGAILLGFTSCGEEEAEYTPAEAPTNAQVYFASNLASTVNLTSSATSFTVDLHRQMTSTAATVALSVTDGTGKLSIPSSVEFASGAATATLTIGYNPADFTYDEFSEVSISIAETDATPYGVSTYTFKVGMPAPWVSLGMATYREDFVTTLFGVENVSYKVEIQENQEKPGLYRLVNPYGAAYPYNEPGDFDESKNYYMEINAQDPDGVYITQTVTGTDWGYGNMIMWSMANYYMVRQGATVEDMKAAGYCGTLKDGVITFPKESLLFGMADYNDGGLYPANANGAFMVAFPGVVIADYSATIEYAGLFTDASDANAAVVKVTLGEDVESAKVAMAATKDVDAIVAAILDGSLESVEVVDSGFVSLPVEEAGKYTAVAISFGAGKPQKIASTTFDIYLGGSPFDALIGGSIDAYEGNWAVPVWNSSGSGHLLATMTKGEDANGIYLTVKGLSTWASEGYDDTFYMDYDPETGWVYLYPQNVNTFSYKGTEYPTILAGANYEEGKLYTSAYLIGGLTEDGTIKFLNASENEVTLDSFLFYANGLGTISYFTGLEWMPYTSTRNIFEEVKPNGNFQTFQVINKVKPTINNVENVPFLK